MDFAAQPVLDLSDSESSYNAPLPSSSARSAALSGTARSRFTRTVPEPLSVPVEGINREISVKIASTADEWEQAFRLVAQRYKDRGYVDANEDGNYFTLFHALPDTAVFVANEGDRTIATLSLVPDNTALGLPMEVAYRDEIDNLRIKGHRLSEISCLADEHLSLREFMPVFMSLCRLMFQYSAHQGCNEWVIEVNPRHSRFYRKVWGFVPLGPRRACPTVSGAPAEAFYLDIDTMKTNAPDTYEFIYGEPLDLDALTPVAMPKHMMRRLAMGSVRTDLESVEGVMSLVSAYGNPRLW